MAASVEDEEFIILKAHGPLSCVPGIAKLVLGGHGLEELEDELVGLRGDGDRAGLTVLGLPQPNPGRLYVVLLEA